jgi:glycosyltransferase involved in cell wall biosynthesis
MNARPDSARRQSRSTGGRSSLRIAMLAPPWIPVPPPAYGGVEAVVAVLCDELSARGHQVTLFAAPPSRSRAEVRELLEEAHPDSIGASLFESDHVACAWDEIDRAAERGRPFDLVHDHCGFTALAMASRISLPVVHTVHGAFTAQTACFYARHAHKAHLVAISETQLALAPRGVRPAAVVPNPLLIDDWPLRHKKDDYVLWMGRMDPVKGAHRAIAAARRCGQRLVLAGPVQRGQADYFRNELEPRIDEDSVSFVGEVGGARRKDLFARARALLMPIRWAEPFGMVMIEALACGTPVLAFPEGAASEIVIDGENGFLVADEWEMSAAIERLDAIDPLNCRASVAGRYDVGTVADRYESVYQKVLRATRRPVVPFERRLRISGPERAAETRVPPGAQPALQRTG